MPSSAGLDDHLVAAVEEHQRPVTDRLDARGSRGVDQFCFDRSRRGGISKAAGTREDIGQGVSRSLDRQASGYSGWG